MSSYNENIARLKQASSSNTALANQYETQAAQAEGQWHIDHANKGTLLDFPKPDLDITDGN